jgi:protein-disulfide isomerase
MTTVTLRFILALLLASAMAPAQCAAQPQQQGTIADLQKQIDALRAQVGAMQKDLDDIKELLAPIRAQLPPKPGDISLDLGNRPVRGNPAATLILVEFTDYQ